jgi:hypothetical protein
MILSSICLVKFNIKDLINRVKLECKVILLISSFLIAGKVAPGSPLGIQAVENNQAEDSNAYDLLGLSEEGFLRFNGADITIDEFIALVEARKASGQALEEVRLMPDQALPAQKLLNTVSDLSTATGLDIVIVGVRNRS